MEYFKLKQDRPNQMNFLNNKKEIQPVFKFELITRKEFDYYLKLNFKEIRKHFDRLEVSKNKTYWFCGCRKLSTLK